MFRLWRRPKGREGEWFYCVRHNKVEEGPECRALDRLGPYETRAEAEHALEIARERNASWENDPHWNDPGPDTPDTPGTPGAPGTPNAPDRPDTPER